MMLPARYPLRATRPAATPGTRRHTAVLGRATGSSTATSTPLLSPQQLEHFHRDGERRRSMPFCTIPHHTTPHQHYTTPHHTTPHHTTPTPTVPPHHTTLHHTTHHLTPHHTTLSIATSNTSVACGPCPPPPHASSGPCYSPPPHILTPCRLPGPAGLC